MAALEFVADLDTDTLPEPPLGLLGIWLADWVDRGAPLLFVARSEPRARALAAAVASLEPKAAPVLFPPWDCLPYDRAQPSRAAMGQRMTALRRLAEDGTPPLVITTLAAIAQRMPPLGAITTARLVLTVGQDLDRERLTGFLRRTGYRLDDRVDEAGEAALRGAVVDLFPADAATPVRLELEGERITAIRAYDALTQRSLADVAEVAVGPASEILACDGESAAPDQHALPLHYPELTTLLACVPEARLILDGDVPARLEARAEQVANAYAMRRALHGSEAAGGAARMLVEPARLYLDAQEWHQALAARAVLRLERQATVNGDTEPELPTRAKLLAHIRQRLGRGERVTLALPASDPLRTWLKSRLDPPPLPVAGWRELASVAPGAVGMLTASLPSGFSLDGLHVLAGKQLPRQSSGKAASDVSAALTGNGELRLGDRVVHADHGIAELLSLDTIEADGRATDHLALAFAGGRRLLVPTTDLDRIWRYGSDAADVSLDPLDGDAWRARREAVMIEIAAASAELASRIADRAATVGPSLPLPPGYDRFVRRFPFELSRDQAHAIAATLGDLARGGPPMDRLVCGDVGFGKTEVALRAAAVAALNGRQVAVLAPTTILVGQHLQTFRRRFAGFDLRVEQLSRLGGGKEMREVRAGLADGSVRIVIGTHALASPRLRFADLGLVVIDEEQRFGRKQKAALAGLRRGAHVLTMSATPIPRTLQAAQAGLQELSVIATPPQRRLPIRTFVLPFDPTVVREALQRERGRNGRSFVVVPRIADLEPTRTRLAASTSDLAVAVAHGRMPPAQLGRLMLDFADGGYDVLLTTSIVEAGLDIPGANTMIVWKPDRFGIAQLHQLRGRVGRGRERGACYLLPEPGASLSEAALRRLQALESLESLGAGFAVSARDLDLRGAGSLFGDEQAGHLERIGIGLYQHLLDRAVRRARGETVAEEWAPELVLNVTALLPAKQIPEPEVRLELYARLARLADDEVLDDLAEEIADRFGEPAAETRHLFELTRLRLRCRDLDVAKLEVGPKAAAATFRADLPPDGRMPDGLRRSEDRLVLDRDAGSDEERLASGHALLARLEAILQPKKARNSASTSAGRSSGR